MTASTSLSHRRRLVHSLLLVAAILLLHLPTSLAFSNMYQRLLPLTRRSNHQRRWSLSQRHSEIAARTSFQWQSNAFVASKLGEGQKRLLSQLYSSLSNSAAAAAAAAMPRTSSPGGSSVGKRAISLPRGPLPDDDDDDDGVGASIDDDNMTGEAYYEDFEDGSFSDDPWTEPLITESVVTKGRPIAIKSVSSSSGRARASSHNSFNEYSGSHSKKTSKKKKEEEEVDEQPKGPFVAPFPDELQQRYQKEEFDKLIHSQPVPGGNWDPEHPLAWAKDFGRRSSETAARLAPLIKLNPGDIGYYDVSGLTMPGHSICRTVEQARMVVEKLKAANPTTTFHACDT